MQSGPWIADRVRNDSHFKQVLLQFPSPLADVEVVRITRCKRFTEGVHAAAWVQAQQQKAVGVQVHQDAHVFD